VTHFGSGWVFLVGNPSSGRLEILSLPDQDSVLLHGNPGLLCSDVWEHAYYLKHRNRRLDYLQAWWNVVAWSVVAERLHDFTREMSPLQQQPTRRTANAQP
jgi:superoxide dismutase, Fe-Mn family